MKVAVIGAGRIGRVHIENISTGVREMEIKTVADPFLNADSEAFIKSFGIPNATKDVDSVFADPEIEAVLICSSTDTHADLIVQAAAAGKHIFCEKPVDHDVARVRWMLSRRLASSCRLVLFDALTTTIAVCMTQSAAARLVHHTFCAFLPATHSRLRLSMFAAPVVSSMT